MICRDDWKQILQGPESPSPSRPQEHLWQEQQDLHHQLGDSIVSPSRSLQGVAEEIVEADIVEEEVIGSPKTPNKDTNTIF